MVVKRYEKGKNKISEYASRVWKFFWKDDSIWSWLFSFVLAFLVVKFVFFPLLSVVFATSMPLVVVESSSMHHPGSVGKSITGLAISEEDSFENWWERVKSWYEENDIEYSETDDWSFKTGLDKGDIILIKGTKEPEIGDIIVFYAGQKHPIIHRIVKIRNVNGEITYETKGDNNSGQLLSEKNIPEDALIGKAIMRIPKLGWIKLIFVKIVKNFV